MMNKYCLLNLIEKLIEKNKRTIISPEVYLSHTNNTYDIAMETADKAILNYPNLEEKLRREEVALAGGLHDIGRLLKKDQLFHELRGAKFIEEKGLELRFAASLKDAYRLAQMFRSHFVVFELFTAEENKEKRTEFEMLDSEQLIPKTWQELIIIYSDLTNENGKIVSVQERIRRIQKRYCSSSFYSKVLQRGLPRILKYCEDIEKLVKGELSEKETGMYQFI